MTVVMPNRASGSSNPVTKPKPRAWKKRENRQTGGEQRERAGINSAPHEEEPSRREGSGALHRVDHNQHEATGLPISTTPLLPKTSLKRFI